MTTPSDDAEPQPESDTSSEGPAPTARVMFQTPFGTFDDPADLPPAIRHALAQNLDSIHLPDEIREQLRASLSAADAVAPGDGNEGLENYREWLWQLLDSAFPDAPHLWSAGEALLSLAEHHPHRAEIGDSQREGLLKTATLHLQHHAWLTSPPSSFADQLVTKFREQMGGL